MGEPKLQANKTIERINLSVLFCLSVFLIFICTSCENAPVELPKLDGTWKTSFNNIKIIENWSKKGNTLVGTTVWELDTNRRVDHLTIHLNNDQLIYSLKIDNKPPIRYYCKNPYSDTLVFGNQDNDYPKRIVYVKPKGKIMTAWIDNHKNDTERIVFNFEQVRK